MKKRNSVKLSITLPAEMVDILDMYCEYNSMKRSSAIAYFMASGLCYESEKTNGFDFEMPYCVGRTEDGKNVYLKYCEIRQEETNWYYSLGSNRQGKIITVDSKEISELNSENFETDNSIDIDKNNN